jgi:hypothetical protein
VVDPRVEAHLAQQQHAPTLGVAVEVAHLFLAVGRRDHVPAVVDAVPGDQILKRRRQHVDHDIRLLDLGGSEAGILDVEVNGGPPWMITDSLAGEVLRQVAHGDEPVLLFGVFEEVGDQVWSALAGPDDQDFLHGDVPPVRLEPRNGHWHRQV